MAIIFEPDESRLCACGEVAEYVCDGCGALLCYSCKADINDPDCPDEFCEKCLNEPRSVR